MDIVLDIIYIVLLFGMLVRVLQKAGFNPWWAAAMLVPGFNAIMVWIFALSAWPSSPRKDNIWKL